MASADPLFPCDTTIGSTASRPAELFAAVDHGDRSDDPVLRRLWHNLYGDEPYSGGQDLAANRELITQLNQAATTRRQEAAPHTCYVR